MRRQARQSRNRVVLVLAGLMCSSAAMTSDRYGITSGCASETAPAWDWETAAPESQGLSGAKLDAL